MDDQSLMREWASGPFRLELHEPNRWPAGDPTPIGYRFYHHDQLILEGDDISVPAGQTLDGDQTVRERRHANCMMSRRRTPAQRAETRATRLARQGADRRQAVPVQPPRSHHAPTSTRVLR